MRKKTRKRNYARNVHVEIIWAPGSYLHVTQIITDYMIVFSAGYSMFLLY